MGEAGNEGGEGNTGRSKSGMRGTVVRGEREGETKPNQTKPNQTNSIKITSKPNRQYGQDRISAPFALTLVQHCFHRTNSNLWEKVIFKYAKKYW
jgi:hypothetical protein